MRKLSKNARISSSDANGHTIEISLKFKSSNALEPSEVREVTIKAARAIADHIRNLPYTDFGPENTRINL
jgi:hypothetical protein